MSGYSPPSSPAAAPPPNRQPQRKGLRALVLWIVLIAIFAAFYQFFAPREGAPRKAPRPAPVAESREHGPLALFLLPLAVGLGLTIWLRRLRIQPGELPAVAPEPPPPPATPPVPSHAPVRLEGKARGAKAALTLDLSGVRWERDGRLLAAPEAMEVPYVDIEALRFHTTAPARVWAIVLAIFDLSYTLQGGGHALPTGLGIGVVAIVLWVAKFTRATTVHFVTRTHTLQLQGRGALAEREAAALEALYQHRPDLRVTPGVGLVAFYRRELRALVASDAALAQQVRAESTRATSDLEVQRMVRMRRALAVWNTGWTIWLPVSIGLAWSFFAIPSPVALFACALFSAVGSIVGLVLSGRLVRVLSWLTNIPVQKRPAAQPATS